MIVAEKHATPMTLQRTLRAYLFSANITLSKQLRTDLPRTPFTHVHMPGADHFPAQFTLTNMVHTDMFSTHVTAKCTLRTHLLPAKCAGMRLRLTNVPVAARTGHETVKTDRFMAEIAFNQMNLTDELTALFTRSSAMTAKMLPAFQTPESMLAAKTFSAQMTLHAALPAHPFPTFSATFDSALLTDVSPATAARLQTLLAHHVKLVVADSDRVHLLPTG